MRFGAIEVRRSFRFGNGWDLEVRRSFRFGAIEVRRSFRFGGGWDLEVRRSFRFGVIEVRDPSGSGIQKDGASEGRI